MGTLPADLSDREARLDEILASYLHAEQVGQAADPKELVHRHPDLAPELEAFFANERCIDRLASPLRSIHRAAAAPARGEVFGDYEILDEIAHGGMGVVYQARQRSLSRLVALKMLRSGPLADPSERQRFRAEAAAFAHLDHPNIVPIYEVGEQDGRLYFSMKLMEGSLAQQIGRFLDDPRGAGRLVEIVADAVHYAHQRGFLHRDLKPANILLDAAGAPHVSDFGLAKRLVAEPGSSFAALTQTGAILGTPSYMAPEQASGGRDGMTTAADVYSLGAILYELLTGRPPFRADTPLATLRQAQEQEPARPRALNRRVDRDLETICLKCLEKDPRRRYVSAAELANELRRYREGHPIQARPVGSAGSLLRWCRRRPLVAALTGSLVASFLLGFALVAWQWQRAERHANESHANALQAEANALIADANAARAEAHARQAEADRQRAQADFARAYAIVTKLVHVGERELLNVPGAQPIRKQLLDQSLQYYREFLRERGDDPRLARELADAQVSVARLTDAIGSRTEALGAYRNAQDVYRRLLERRPDDRELQTKLAWATFSVGTLLKTTGQPAEAIKTYDEACEQYRRLLKDRPDDPEPTEGLANTLVNLGLRLKETGRRAEALTAFAEAQVLREKLVRRNPHTTDDEDSLAGIYNVRAAALEEERDRAAEAKAIYQKGQAIRENLARNYPEVTRYRRGLAEIYHNLGVVEQRLRNPAAAADYFRKSFDVNEQLVRENPSVNQFRRDLAGSHINLGIAEANAGRRDKALERYEQARVLQEQLVKENPRVPGYRKDLARSFFTIAEAQNRLGRRDEALAAYEKSRDLLEELVKSDADNLDFRRSLARTLNNLGVLQAQRNRFDEGRATLRRAIDQQLRVMAREPDSSESRQTLNNHYGSLGEIERVAGNLTEATTLTLERRKLCSKNAAELYRVAHDMALIAGQVGKGRAILSDAERSDRDRYAALAIDVLKQTIDAGFRDAERLRKDTAFALLRERDDFQQQLRRAETAAKP